MYFSYLCHGSLPGLRGFASTADFNVTLEFRLRVRGAECRVGNFELWHSGFNFEAKGVGSRLSFARSSVLIRRPGVHVPELLKETHGSCTTCWTQLKLNPTRRLPQNGNPQFEIHLPSLNLQTLKPRYVWELPATIGAAGYTAQWTSCCTNRTQSFQSHNTLNPKP